MTDDDTRSASPAADGRWLLLIHQIPPKPDYLRVKIGRRLARVGAVAIKNSVYVLPASPQALEDLEWIRKEVADGGGDAMICQAELIAGLSDETVRDLFRRARSEEYQALEAGARAAASPTIAEYEVATLERRLAAVAKLDFFEALAGVTAREAIAALRARVPAATSPRDARVAGAARLRARTWVTREGIFVDRIGSAWLIRRFIDPEARFKFVAARGYRPKKDELRFDMFEAEFTHEGDRCTFETLVTRFVLDDPALREIAEVVHDIDLKDGKFARDDASGIERVLAGIARASESDDARLERGGQLFDALYESFAGVRTTDE